MFLLLISLCVPILSAFLPDCFRYRLDYTFASSATGPSDVQLVIDTASLIGSGRITDCSDLRFRQLLLAGGGTWLDYWYESQCDDEATRVWVTPTFEVTDAIVEVYYGCQLPDGSPDTPPAPYGSEETWTGGEFIALSDTAGCGSWTDVTTDFNGRYLRVVDGAIGATFPGSVVGHTHDTNTFLRIAGAIFDWYDQSPGNDHFMAPRYHQHPLDTLSVALVGDPEPPYQSVHFCESSELNLPQNLIVPLTTDFLIASGRWTRYGGLDDNLIRGGACCGTGGADQHYHTLSGSCGLCCGQDVEAQNDGLTELFEDPQAMWDHVHSIPSTDTATALNWPTYVPVVFAQVTSALGGDAYDDTMVFLSRSATLPPKGFIMKSEFDGAYLRGSMTRGSRVVAPDPHHTALILADSSSTTATKCGGEELMLSHNIHQHYNTLYETSTAPGAEDLERIEIHAIGYNSSFHQGGVVIGTEVALECGGLYWNDPFVCSSRGTCDGEGNCDCDLESGREVYYDPTCSTESVCGGTAWDIVGVCGGFGYCVAPSVCNCQDHRWGPECENENTCDGVLWNAGACDGHGDCIGPADDLCDCDAEWFGVYCDVTKCYEFFSNSSAVCTFGAGDCSAPDTCTCVLPTLTGDECADKAQCYNGATGTWFDFDDSRSCTGHGTCTSQDTCSCDTYHAGNACEIPKCGPGFIRADSPTACTDSSHGVCTDVVAPFLPYCSCLPGWSGTECEYPVCGGVASNEPGVCQSRGVCTTPDVCSCTDPLWEGNECTTKTRCGSVVWSDSSVCNGNGICLGSDSCACFDGFGGDSCELTTCDGTLSDSPSVCNSGGSCWNVDACLCDATYYGEFCEEHLPVTAVTVVGQSTDEFLTFEIPYYVDRSFVTIANEMDCSEFNCTWRVFRDDLDLLGITSTCRWLSADDSCGPEITRLELTVEGPKLITPSLSRELEIGVYFMTSVDDFEKAAISLVLQLDLKDSFLSASTIVGIVAPFVVVIVAVVVILVSLTVCACLYRKRLRKLDTLDDVDILLAEQEASRDTSKPKLNISTKTLAIPWEDVKLDRMIAKGGSDARVFLASYRGSEVAIKLFKISAFVDDTEDSFEEFERECTILGGLHHPYVLRFFGATLHPPSRVGIVMEYCPNGDLEQFLTDQLEEFGTPYPLKEKLRMITEVTSAIAYLHSFDIIHRDVKLLNVLVTRSEETRLTDFGLSKSETATKNSRGHTRRVGTSFFMSPEVFLGGSYSFPCDIFSLALLIYIVLTGKEDPYDSHGKTVEAQVAMDPKFRPKVTPNTPETKIFNECPFIVPLLKNCWTDKVDTRPTAAQLLEQLNEGIGGLSQIADMQSMEEKIDGEVDMAGPLMAEEPEDENEALESLRSLVGSLEAQYADLQKKNTSLKKQLHD